MPLAATQRKKASRGGRFGIRRLAKADKIPGGLADKKKSSDFDASALAAGVKVEMEHTSSREIATEIAMDHLTEDPHYYRKLKTIEKGVTRFVMRRLFKAEQLSFFGAPTAPKQRIVVQAYLRRTPTKVAQVMRHERAARPTKGFDGAKHAKKLRKLADGMQKKVDGLLPHVDPSVNMTWKRSNQAASKHHDWQHAKTTQATLRLLAERAADGELAPELRNLGSLTALEHLRVSADHPARIRGDRWAVDMIDRGYGKDSPAAERVRDWIRANVPKRMQQQDEVAHDWTPGMVWTEKWLTVPMSMLDDITATLAAGESNFGWYAAELPKRMRRAKSLGLETDEEWKAARAELLNYWEQAESGSAEDPKAKKLREKTEAAKLLKIPGYFPTPKPLVDNLLDEAGIEPGDLVLEPSAGMGDIANALKATGATVHVGEYQHSLYELLELQGHEMVSRDFLAYNPGEIYDKIVQNPPFEGGQDIDHVLHAYDLLKPGGRLVSIMGEGAFFQSTKKPAAFRTWLNEVGWSQKNPEGSFKSATRSTGVATRTVVIDKPGGGS